MLTKKVKYHDLQCIMGAHMASLLHSGYTLLLNLYIWLQDVSFVEFVFSSVFLLRDVLTKRTITPRLELVCFGCHNHHRPHLHVLD